MKALIRWVGFPIRLFIFVIPMLFLLFIGLVIDSEAITEGIPGMWRVLVVQSES